MLEMLFPMSKEGQSGGDHHNECGVCGGNDEWCDAKEAVVDGVVPRMLGECGDGEEAVLNVVMVIAVLAMKML